MELKDFVSATLQQILEGVSDAQKEEIGIHVNAENPSIPDGNKVFNVGMYGTHTIVEFDVAVNAETSGKGGANLKVFGVGAEAGGEHKTAQANRISFSVPVRLPGGGRAE